MFSETSIKAGVPKSRRIWSDASSEYLGKGAPQIPFFLESMLLSKWPNQTSHLMHSASVCIQFVCERDWI